MNNEDFDVNGMNGNNEYINYLKCLQRQGIIKSASSFESFQYDGILSI